MHEAHSPPSRRLCRIGTIGSRGVGKTSLSSAITKVLAETGAATFATPGDIDHTEEERHRGIGVFTTALEYETALRRYIHFDTPGVKVFNWPDRAEEIRSTDRLSNMVAAAEQMDGAILVASALLGLDCIDSIRLAREAGVPALVVFMNGMDEVLANPEPERRLENLEYHEADIRETLAAQGFPVDGLPVIRGSALAALEDRNPDIGREAILRLLDAVDRFIPYRDDIHFARDYSPQPT